jgi:ribosomal protein S18 acetylase RimI-like enzyme
VESLPIDKKPSDCWSRAQKLAPDRAEIHVFQERDEEQVVSLWKRVFGYLEPRNDPATVIRQKMAVQPELFFVAVADGKVVGTVMGGYDGHRGWIYTLAVDPAHRGQKVATALIHHVEIALAELGCPKINLQVLESNAGAVDFYEKLGYRGEERISMGKVLGEATPIERAPRDLQDA